MHTSPPVPKVSIVIAAWNAERTIERAVDSALSQTYRNIDLYIVNDGSTDQTQVILEGYADDRIHLIYQGNQGAASARNAGWRMSQAPYIHFLDSDDVLLPRAIESQVKLLEMNTHQEAFAYGAYLCVSEKGYKIKSSAVPKTNGMLGREAITREGMLQNNVCTIPRRLLETVGGFDEDLLFHEDRIFYLKLAYQFSAVANPECIALYTQSVSGKARRSVAKYEEAMATHEAMLAAGKTFFDAESQAVFESVTWNSLCSRFMLYGFMNHALAMRSKVDVNFLRTGLKGWLTWLSLIAHVNLLAPAFMLSRGLNRLQGIQTGSLHTL